MLDPQLVEAAIRRDDSAAVRDLLKHATESERAACAKTLKGFLTGPKWHAPGMVMLAPQQFMDFMRSGYQQMPEALRRQEEQQEELNRDYNAWRELASKPAFRLAALGLAGGVMIAAKVGADFDSWKITQAEVEQIAVVLADRRPGWLAEYVDRNLTSHFGIPAWQLARALVRLGAISRPSVAEYTTAMPYSAQLQAHNGDLRDWPTPAAALLADPGLLDDEFWRLFTVPDAAHVLEQDDRMPSQQDEAGRETWSQSIAKLCAERHLDRGRVIDACLDAFTRDFNPNRVGWYAVMLKELNPSEAEIAERADKYLGLLRATSKAGITVGQQGARVLLDTGRLDAGGLLAASAPALLFPQKAIAATQLKLVAAVAAKYPALRPAAAVAAAAAFGHERQDIQETALKLITKLGVPDGPQLGEIQLRAMDLSPSLAADAAVLGLLPGAVASAPEQGGAAPPAGISADVADELADVEKRISALPTGPRQELTAALDLVRHGDVPGPVRVRPGAGGQLPPPVTDPEELVQLLTVLIEGASDAVAAERALAGAVRLSSLPVSQRRQLAAPLLKRTQRVMHLYRAFSGSHITSDLAIIASVWAGEHLNVDRGDREAGWHMPGQYAVASSGRALTMAGIFSARAWEAATIIEAGCGGLLLAEPETERGAISASTLRQRIRELAGRSDGSGRALRHDREQALLRLEPGVADPELWKAWAPVAGQSAAALRESHQVIQSPVSFEAVTGEPTGQPLRASQEWYTHLLARTRGKVPTTPCCECWQLLTDLTDPLHDHEVLYGPSRYQTRHYDAAVAGWTLICPWQPEIAAAHLLRPLCDGLIPGITPATIAMASMRHPAHALGPVGHLALMTGLSSAEADTRIAAAGLWADAAADGRLDPALAAAAIATGVRGDALKLSRIASGLEYASHTELAARRTVETICAAFAELPLGPANMHMLVELAARLGARTGVPELPAAVPDMAARRGGSRIITTARQLEAAASSDAPDRGQAGAQALTALVMRAEAAAGS